MIMYKICDIDKKWFKFFNKEFEIDKELREIIFILNYAIGCDTDFCCRGRYTIRGMNDQRTKDGRHSLTAYISFEKRLSHKIIKEAIRLGLQVTHNRGFGGTNISVLDLYPECSKCHPFSCNCKGLIKKRIIQNKKFPNKIKRLFKIK